MYYKKERMQDGDYIETRTGCRYSLSVCRRITSPDGVNVGWTKFTSAAECLNAWGIELSPFNGCEGSIPPQE